MTEDSTSAEIRKLVMLISDLRSKDNERYTEHVRFTNEVISFINKISDNMNDNWEKINKTLTKLNQTIEDSLNSLLTGINPEGIKETSSSLKEIMDTMSKSMQSINLENVMRELKALRGISPSRAISIEQSGAESISTQFGSPYGSSSETEGNNGEPEIYGYVPDHMKKKQKKKEKKESHLLKPSDLFKQ